MSWYLVILVWVGSVYANPSYQVIEFPSREACESVQAVMRDEWIQAMSQTDKLGAGYFTRCVQVKPFDMPNPP